jgi:hypothetical protein
VDLPVSQGEPKMRYQSETMTMISPLLVDDPAAPTGIEAVISTSEAMSSLRGISDAAADVSECACPEACERDHANE